MHAECVRRTGARRPLVVGDRLDTDIEGARRAGAASLLVFTGVTEPAALLAAGPEHRPDLIAADCTGLLTAHPEVVPDADGWRCGGWWAGPDGSGVLTLRPAPAGDGPEDDDLDGLRALCVAHWQAAGEQATAARVAAGDESAGRLLAAWGLRAD
jgi:glycerol-1-phosphatase